MTLPMPTMKTARLPTIRLSATILAAIVLLLFFNIPGDRRELPRVGSEWAFVDFSDHGWPWIYLTSSTVQFSLTDFN